MALNVPLLRSSFDLVASAEPELAAKFYVNLFAKYPQLRPMFANTSMADQQKMLTDALVAVIEHLEDAPWLDTTLRLLGRRHVSYNVTVEMYDMVGDALLTTLAQIAGPQWNDELNEAWGEAYGAITGLMKNGIANAA